MIDEEELVLFDDFMLKLLGEIKSPQTVNGTRIGIMECH